jgi:hypothetical protein
MPYGITKVKNLNGHHMQNWWQTRTAYQDADKRWRPAGGWRQSQEDATSYASESEALAVNAINGLRGTVVKLDA